MTSPTPDLPPEERPRPFSPGTVLDYSRRPPPVSTDTAVMDFIHGVIAIALYVSVIIVMKAAAMHFRWELGAICGAWLTVLVVSLGLAGWLYGAYGWRGVMTGTLLAILLSLIAAPLILGG